MQNFLVRFLSLRAGGLFFGNRFYPARRLFFIRNFFTALMPGRHFFLSRLKPAGLLLSLPPKKVDKEPAQQPSAIELARMAEAPEGRRSQSASSRFRLVESRSFSPAFSRQNTTFPERLSRAQQAG
ncbi:hypothetical protein [uncultured Rikenella sp.]|uniref:hypothetical protein n=1 Tax=uncultured Rikenella sp. TaxID=368003 RepID=UPI0026382F9D|nr:hypothetical protein [uncultured Rikenella sp.]